MFDNFEYHCTIDENCPSDRSKLIVDKNECVEACFGDYKFEIFNKLSKKNKFNQNLELTTFEKILYFILIILGTIQFGIFLKYNSHSINF